MASFPVVQEKGDSGQTGIAAVGMERGRINKTGLLIGR